MNCYLTEIFLQLSFLTAFLDQCLLNFSQYQNKKFFFVYSTCLLKLECSTITTLILHCTYNMDFTYTHTQTHTHFQLNCLNTHIYIYFCFSDLQDKSESFPQFHGSGLTCGRGCPVTRQVNSRVSPSRIVQTLSEQRSSSMLQAKPECTIRTVGGAVESERRYVKR